MTQLRRKKSNKKGKRARLTGLFVIIVLVLYIPAMWKWFFTKSVETGIIQEDILEVKVFATGVFIRDEMVLTAENSGIIIPTAQYGERVPTRGNIASFASKNTQDLLKQYQNEENEILLRILEKAKASGYSDVKEIDEDFTQDVANLSVAANKADLQKVAAIRTNLNGLLSEQARKLISDTKDQNFAVEEKQELQKLRNRTSKMLNPIIALKPGIVCYEYDGYESIWTPEMLNSITVGAITMQPVTKAEERYWVTPEDIAVTKDEPYGKLVQNDTCWVALKVDEKTFKRLVNKLESAQLAKTETTISVEIEGLKDRIPMQLVAANGIADEQGNALIIGKMTRFVEQTMELRKVNMQIIVQSLKGMKVPEKSVFNINNVDGTADIMLMKSKRADLRRVKIVGLQDSWAVIENLNTIDAAERVSIYDLYLVNPDHILDGQVMEK